MGHHRNGKSEMPSKKKPDTTPLMGEKDIAVRVERDGGDALNQDLMKSDDRVTRQQSAVALRLSGVSYSDIARVLEYESPSHARQAVERALAATADQPEELKHARTLQVRRYERLLQSTMSKAVNPEAVDHLAYNARAMAILDRLSKLQGLDAPTQVQFTPTDEYIQTYMKDVLTAAGVILEEAEEANLDDIQDAEVILDAEG